MFGFFRSAVVVDPELGTLRYARGRWHGELKLAGTVSDGRLPFARGLGDVVSSLPASRDRPLPDAPM